MNKSFTTVFSYVRYRVLEFPIWLGVPVLGACYARGPFFDRIFVWFLAGTACFMAHILLFNDWGGMIKNPLEAKRYNPDCKEILDKNLLLYGAILCFALSVFFYVKVKPILVALLLAGGILSFLYSAPGTHWKERLLFSKGLHLLGGEVKFLMGFCAFSTDLIRGIMIGLFYAAIFVAGNLVHECIHLEQDRQGRLKTAAVGMGAGPLLGSAWFLFLATHGYFLVLATIKVITWEDCAIFSAPILLHLKYAGISGIWCVPSDDPISYRKDYRWWYAAATMIFILKQISVQMNF